MKKMSDLLVFIVMIGCFSPSLYAVVIINSDIVIQEADIYNEDIEIYDYPPGKTTVLMTGGVLTLGFNSYDSSTVNVWAGNIWGVVNTFDNSTINIIGGTHTSFEINNQSEIKLNGGYVTGLCGYDQSTLFITGGKSESLGGFNQSIIHLSGGLIMKTMFMKDSSIINIYGYDFHYDPFAGHYDSGQLTGYWANGTAFSIDCFDNTTYNHVVFHVIPEPGTVLLFMLGGVVFLKKR